MRIRQIKEVNADVSEQIKAARRNSPKSLKAICQEVGCSVTYWYDIEKSAIKGTLSIENLRKIEQVLCIDLGVTLDEQE